MMRRSVLVVSLLLLAGQCSAQYARFDSDSDTISIAGQSMFDVEATYEARIMPTSNAYGLIFNEWSYGQEDKALEFGSDRIHSYGFPVNYPVSYLVPVSLDLNTWYHVAYVYDGQEERLYLDGQLVGARPWDAVQGGFNSNRIYNANDSIAAVGAIFRWDAGAYSKAFIGCIDTLRISTVARYSGLVFDAPTCDLKTDHYTNLLYNFNEAPGATTVTDLSGNGRHGTLGAGFTGATSPEFVPEPSCIAALLCGLGGLIWRSRKRS